MTSHTSTIETVISEGTVILRESEVDSLDEAVRRVREDEATRHARILIVDSGHPIERSVATGAATANPAVETLLDPSTPMDAVDRLQEQVACLGRFLGEAGEVFQQAGTPPAEALRSLHEIHQWSAAVLEEMTHELGHLQRGETRVSVRAALRGTAAQVPLEIEGISSGYRVWARPTQLAELFGLARWLVSERSGGAEVTVGTAREPGRRLVDVVFRATGTARPVRDASARIARLRELTHELGGSLPAPESPEPLELRVRLPLA